MVRSSSKSSRNLMLYIKKTPLYSISPKFSNFESMQGRKAIKDHKSEIPGKLEPYEDPDRKFKNVYHFPPLYKKNSRGNVMEWRIFVRVEVKGKVIKPTYDNLPKKAIAYRWTWSKENTESGGAVRVSDDFSVEEGLNLGKINATTVLYSSP